MAAAPPRLTLARLVFVVLASPFFVLHGVVVLARSLARLRRRVHGATRALDATLTCENHHPNPTVGRWTCATCHATYHGWVGRCPCCGAGAGWMTCEICQIGIPFPWRS